MSTSYKPDGNTANCGAIAAGTGATVNGSTVTAEVSTGGTGGGLQSFTLNNGVTDVAALFYQSPSGGLGLSSWPAGNWVIRVNIRGNQIVPLGTLTLDQAYVVRVNGSCASQATVASATGLAIPIDSQGVKTITLSGASQGSTGTGDMFYVVLCFTNGSGNAVTITVDLGQFIDTPLGAGVSVFMFPRHRQRQPRTNTPPHTVYQGRVNRHPRFAQHTGLQSPTQARQRMPGRNHLGGLKSVPPSVQRGKVKRTGLTHTAKQPSPPIHRHGVQDRPANLGIVLLLLRPRLKGRRRVSVPATGQTAQPPVRKHGGGSGANPKKVYVDPRGHVKRARVPRSEYWIHRRRAVRVAAALGIFSTSRARRRRMLRSPNPVARRRQTRFSPRFNFPWTNTRPERRPMTGLRLGLAAAPILRRRRSRGLILPPVLPWRRRRGAFVRAGAGTIRRRRIVRTQVPSNVFAGRVRRGKVPRSGLGVLRRRMVVSSARRSVTPAPVRFMRKHRFPALAVPVALWRKRRAHLGWTLLIGKVKRRRLPGTGQTGAARILRRPRLPAWVRSVDPSLLRGRLRRSVRRLDWVDTTGSEAGQVVPGPYTISAALIVPCGGAVAAMVVSE